MRRLAAVALAAMLGACAHAGAGAPGERAEEAEAGLDAEAFARLEVGERLSAGGERVMALRTAVARVFGRVEALRSAVRERDAAADWAQLVCLEGRVPDVRAFSGRGERAWEAFRGAVLRGEREAAWTRFELMRLARLGVTRALGEARACGSTQIGAAQRPRTIQRDVARVVEATTPPRHREAGRELTVSAALPVLAEPHLE